MEVLNDGNKGKMCKDWGELQNKFFKHRAHGHTEVRGRTQGTRNRTNSSKAGLLSCVVHFAVTVWTEKHANEQCSITSTSGRD